METNTLTKTDNRFETNNVVELTDIYNNFVRDLTVSVKGNLYYRLTNIPNNLTPLRLKESGVRNIKRFKRYLKQAIYTKSVNAINKLFNLVHKRILKVNFSSKLVCDKHEKIQKMKMEWKKQQLITDKLFTEYKTEKGDFYRLDLRF